ncbi:glycosyl hydrolase family 95 catalytic domain-containing protein [Pelagovum pacificum]|uniref:Glycoside hydrolase family 95 protein n=1 Tax=Pelagovum pacificum TaxID=2588711 RepID=A0A5C5GF03_9RHOB|nr:glycoside hydrolase family 95 protein [Pelagovum pacificum]QQA44340.1 glycoside hydrolase family 95 protein [Pelagovum pacificum]TNY32541.1 glycoside hydrolase family 95 protein [Pelagovum pacificum]
MTSNLLRFDRPATEWTAAIPLGNGRLGAMHFGGPARDEYQLNEDTLWSGGPYMPTNPKALDALPEVRRLIFDGEYRAADDLIAETMMAIPLKQMSFQPAGNLWLDFGEAGTEGYERTLDMGDAVSVVTCSGAGTTYRRESFISPVDQCLAIRVSSEGPAPVSLRLSLTSDQPGTARAKDDGSILFEGTNTGAEGIDGQLRFAMRAEVASGSISVDGTTLVVTDPVAVVILLDIATSFVRYDDVSADPLTRLDDRRTAREGRDWAAMRADHVAAHRELFDRFEIDFGDSAQSNLPVPQRVADYASKHDPALAAQYVQFGRYLMICSSRPGTQPATLQGIWNKETDPPWGSKYTTNINLEMNYWLPDLVGLPESVDPVIALVEDLAETGATMAKAHYGASGWVLHHNTDIWRATGPVDGPRWGQWPIGGAWLCAQLWDHACFAGYPDALVSRLYPLMKGCAEFMLDFLVEDPVSGELVTSPSNSPENEHAHDTTICAGPAMDNQVLRDLFDGVADAAVRLGQDAAFAARVRAARTRLPGDRIGSAGQLMEWREDWDMQAPERHHRHVSHLYGLYPSRQINVDGTPDLAAAARRSLEIRGDDATGWGIGWRINLWARLRDGKHAHDVLTLLLSPERTYDNLFDAHPPFQIDGNFGGAAGIIEMLVQSRPGHLVLLPALPAQWPEGRVRGLGARGGLTIDMDWSQGRVTKCRIAGPEGARLVVEERNDRRELVLSPQGVELEMV